MIDLTKIIEALGQLASQCQSNKVGSLIVVALGIIAVAGAWVWKH